MFILVSGKRISVYAFKMCGCVASLTLNPGQMHDMAPLYSKETREAMHA